MTHAKSDAWSDAKVTRWSDEGSNARSDAWECSQAWGPVIDVATIVVAAVVATVSSQLKSV